MSTENATTTFSSCSDGDIRLVGGENVLEGRVEVCINGAWGTVCDQQFSEDESDIICLQIGIIHNGIIITLQ